MKKKLATFILVGGVGFFMASCGDDANKGVEKSQAEAAQEELLTEMAEESDNEADVQTYYLPSALQIGSIFQKSGLEFVPGITNSTENKDKYESKTDRILNFGVYSADLAYIVLNGQSNDAISYLKTVKELSDEIGFGTVFESDDLMKRFESSLGNKDSIINVMIDIQARTDMFVDDNNLQDVTYIIFAGAWVEGMYIGVKATDHHKRHQVSGRLVEQMTILDNLVKALKSNKNQTPEVKEILAEFIKLEKFFNQLEENKNSQNIASFRDYKLSEEHLEELSSTIINLRNKIVNE